MGKPRVGIFCSSGDGWLVINQPEVSRSSRTAILGQRGERVAEKYLLERGLTVRARNWRSGRLGELDLVMDDGQQIVFVEVKTRTHSPYSDPVQAVDQHRLRRLQRLAMAWLKKEQGWHSYRIDIVAIEVTGDEPPKAKLQWLRGVDQ